ncbi:hypothetical protein [uncultured Sphingomonas sp.]|uniref:hypothetical protein n=1 Tax=uncultured Sphingomonas sp. TaxID=158754 RepID=UPI002618B7F1|nr:hypothetical protein [uncultured Sphingomonas sp.]
MARKTTGTTGNGGSTALATVKPRPITPATESTLAGVLGSDRALAKMPGTGGEVVSQEGVTRVTGRDYATGAATVPAAEIYFLDGAKPRGHGVWLGEADKVAWLDPVTGYECIMMRHSPDGFLSGYVGVPDGHPLFGWKHQAVPAELGIEVHGGLSYSRICQDGPSPQRRLVFEARRICHVVVGQAPLSHATEYRVHGDAWWFGFDCNHVYDVVPGRQRDRQRFMGAETGAEYRDDAYVVREILNLAAQLKAVADGRPVPRREGPPLPAIGLDPKRGG